MKKQFITKQFIATLCILAVVGVAVGMGAQGAEAPVSATVTVQNISASVSDGTVEYGTMVAGASADTVDTDTQTATNNGNVTANLNIRGTDSTAWFLKDTAAGATEYRHAFSTDAFATMGTALTLSNQTLASSVAVSGTQDFDLKITTPLLASDFTQQSVNVIVQATL